MPKFRIELQYTMRSHVDITAKDKADAIKKWEDGEGYDDIMPDKELWGGIPYDMVRVVEIKPNEGR